MKIKTLFIAGLLLIPHIFTFAQSLETGKSFRNVSYFNQKPPGKTAVIFAPEILNYEAHDSPQFSGEGDQMLICPMEGRGPKYYKFIDGEWALPGKLPFEVPGICNAVFLMPDGDKIYLLVWDDGADKFYVCEKEKGGWTDVLPLSNELNSSSPTPWRFSVSENENIYYSHEGIVVMSVWDGKRHLKPVKLKLENNSFMKGVTPYISPDETYILYSIRKEENIKNDDIHISYRLDNGSWSLPVNLGYNINSRKSMDRCPIVSPDGKYIFLLSKRHGADWRVFWADAGVIEDLKQRNTN